MRPAYNIHLQYLPQLLSSVIGSHSDVAINAGPARWTNAQVESFLNDTLVSNLPFGQVAIWRTQRLANTNLWIDKLLDGNERVFVFARSDVYFDPRSNSFHVTNEPADVLLPLQGLRDSIEILLYARKWEGTLSKDELTRVEIVADTLVRLPVPVAHLIDYSKEQVQAYRASLHRKD